MNGPATCPGKLKFKTRVRWTAPIQTFTAVFMPQFVGFAGMTFGCRRPSIDLNV